MARVVDLVFALRGESIPADHAWALYRALVAALDWLEDDALAGVHRIRGAQSAEGVVFLGQRAQLLLRVPHERIEAALALAGARLAVGTGLEVGGGHVRALLGHGTLYSPFVTADADREPEFQQAVSTALRTAGVACNVIVGKPRRLATGGSDLRGYSVMLHDLAPEESLRMQAAGLGGGRKLGCGILVPHKSAAAVGA